MRFTLAVVLGVLALGASSGASAHPLAPSVLSFEQRLDGNVTMRWRAPAKRPTGLSLKPWIPEACTQLTRAERHKTKDETAVITTVDLRCEPPNMVGAVIRVDRALALEHQRRRAHRPPDGDVSPRDSERPHAPVHHHRARRPTAVVLRVPGARGWSTCSPVGTTSRSCSGF